MSTRAMITIMESLDLLHSVTLTKVTILRPICCGSDKVSLLVDGLLDVAGVTVGAGVVAYTIAGTQNARVLWGTGKGSFSRQVRSDVYQNYLAI